jgi:long-chain acyl-CoA synthetase
MRYEDAKAALLAPGSPFEIGIEDVRGRPCRVWRTRERSLREKIAKSAVHGDKECMVYGDQRISFSRFVSLVWGAGNTLLREFGMQRHDRVGILAYNRPEWLIALFGATSAGGIGVGLNGWWSPDEVEYGLCDSGCRFLIVDDLQYERVAQVIARNPQIETVFYVGDHAPTGTVPVSRLLVPSSEMPTVPIDEDDPFVLLYTSGTTGRSKACITTHRGTIAQVQGILFNYFVSAMLRTASAQEAVSHLLPAAPAALLTSPLFHVAALHSAVCTSLTAGAKVIFAPAKFDAEQVLELIQRERVTTWMAIPTLLQRLIEHPRVADYDLSSITGVSTGGAPLPPEIAERARAVLKTKPSLSTTYGLTEVHGMATSIAGDEYVKHKTSVGRPIPVMDIRIVDDAGRDLPIGETGQILLGGSTVTPGYWNRPVETAQAVQDGYLHTGDIGRLDELGLLYVSDRKKDMVIRGGENVYCVEIENVLAEHPAISEAAIIGVPDRDLGERVKAIVVRKPDAQLTAADVKAHVAARLAKFKVPEDVELIDEQLPRNPAGKILKNLLRKPVSS